MSKSEYWKHVQPKNERADILKFGRREAARLHHKYFNHNRKGTRGFYN